LKKLRKKMKSKLDELFEEFSRELYHLQEELKDLRIENKQLKAEKEKSFNITKLWKRK